MQEQQQPAWGVMVSHVDSAGMVHTRLWVVTGQTARWIAGQLGSPTVEQVQSREQALAGAQAGQGAVLFGGDAEGGPR